MTLTSMKRGRTWCVLTFLCQRWFPLTVHEPDRANFRGIYLILARDELLEAIDNQRGIHNIHRSFSFASNPQFIFHDSPGFESGDESQLKEVQSFLEQHAASTEVHDQVHAIWSVIHPLSFVY
jgi:hypothetical protein